MSDSANTVETNEVTVAVIDQHPKVSVGVESPLHHLKLDQAPAPDRSAGVLAWEDKLKGHLVLRGHADDAGFQNGVKAALGLSLPGRLQSSESPKLSLRWIAPDEWLLVCDLDQAFAVETALREQLSGHVAIINVSGGQTLIRLAGPNAVDVLKKSAPYDFDDRHFTVGKVVSTVLAKTQAVIRRTGEQSWELVIRRSFADYAWRWLAEAGREYGLQVGEPGNASVSAAKKAETV